MAKSNKRIDRQIGSPKQGMNKDTHPSSLNEQTYTHALNANYEGQDGDIVNLQNEESNILCSRFKPGFKVVGHEIDITADRTYFFLVDDSTTPPRSEIGYIEDLGKQLNFTDTVIKCGCSIEAVLDDGLENQVQSETCTYTTLLADYECPNGETANNCLNFNINYPISSVLKDDKLGKILYFTDDLNPRRRIELDRIEQYYKKPIVCEEDEDVCINCGLMDILPETPPLCIDVEGTVIGGNVEHGVYSFFAGYCDAQGNMVRSYSASTNMFSVKDPNKDVYIFPELDDPTNFSIKLNISNLNNQFEYYKVAVAAAVSVDGAKSYYSIGVFPTSNEEVVFSGLELLGRENRLSLLEIQQQIPEYLTAKIVSNTNNTLFFGDLQGRPDPNLQPVVNFMGEFAKWRTVMADETLHSTSFGTGNYRGYMRDEVIPFGIRFVTNKGYKTPVYPLISRVADPDRDLYFDNLTSGGIPSHQADPSACIQAIRNSDLLPSISSTRRWIKDIYSVITYGNENCNAEERVYKWQYYNTARQERYDIDDCATIGSSTVTRIIEKICSDEANTLVGIETGIPNDASTALRLDFTEDGTTPVFDTAICSSDPSNPNYSPDCQCPQGVEIDGYFTDFASYVQNNQDAFQDIIDDSTGLYSTNQKTLASYFILDNYKEGGLYALDCCDPGFDEDYCTPPTLSNEIIEVLGLESGAPCAKIVYEECSYYQRPGTSDVCFPYSIDPSSGDYKNINTQCGFDIEGDGNRCNDCFDPGVDLNSLYTYEFFVGVRKKKDKYNLVFDRSAPISGGESCLDSSPLPLGFNEYDSTLTTHIIPDFPDIEIEDKDGNTDDEAIAIDKTINSLEAQVTQLMNEDFIAGYGYDEVDARQNNNPGKRIKKKFCTRAKGDIYLGLPENAGSFDNSDNVSGPGLFLKGDYAGFPLVGGVDYGRVHNNAVWYKINVGSNNKAYFTVSRQNAFPSDNDKKDCLWYPEVARVSFFTDCGGTPYTYFVLCSNPSEKDVNSTKIQLNGGDGVIELDIKAAIDSGDFPDGLSEIYVAIDTPICRVEHRKGQKNSCFYPNGINNGGLGANDHKDEDGQNIYYYASGTNCFVVKGYSQAIDYIEAYLSPIELLLEKTCVFKSSCEITSYDNLKCDPFFRSEGTFSYWESADIYPDNEYLYNSQTQITDISNLDLGSAALNNKFNSIYVTGGNLNDKANFTCKPIRHFKFPDVNISPLFGADTTYSAQPLPFLPAKIYPIGFYIDNNVINGFLDLAVDNSLITQDFRNSISHYEIFRGDVKLNASILSKGILFDMYKHTDEDTNDVSFFSNFPYNDLSDNQLLYQKENRKKFIPHPFKDDLKSNNRFTYHSPNTSFDRDALPFEMYVETDYVGYSRGAFARVEDHPRYTVLSNRAYRTARLLSAAETTLDFLTNLSSALVQVGLSGNVGTTTNVLQPVAWVAFGIYALQASLNLVPQGKQNTNKWLTIFRNLGNDRNFASYYSSVGFFNGMYVDPSPTGQEGNKLRGLRERLYIDSGRYRVDEIDEDNNIIINNFNRESSVYLSLGAERDEFDNVYYNFNLDKSSAIRNFDNSRYLASEKGCFKGAVSPEYESPISSPYISLKRFIPSQYGTINSVTWLDTSYCGDLTKNNSCDVVFGGDTFISRMYIKRKFSLFSQPAIVGKNATGDNVPYEYSLYRNIGYPRFYLDYLMGGEDDITVYGNIPNLKSDFNFDCKRSGSIYMKLPSTFYLFYYGIPGFLVESRLNMNFRYGTNETNGYFYPGTTDYLGWTQENYVSIREKETFNYNTNYSEDNDVTDATVFPANYDPEIWNAQFDHYDRIIFSLPDDDESNRVDNFRYFLAGNGYDFGNKYGRLIDLRNIESNKVIVRFENGTAIFNAYNVVTTQGNTETFQFDPQTNRTLFKTRPQEYFKTELGYGGTQHRAMVSCQLGHYWTDAKRGRVYQISTQGSAWEEISNKGMKNWFRENLPFRIKTQFQDIPNDMLDNALDGLGIVMTWDDRYLRLFLTKLDAKVKSSITVWTGEDSSAPNNSMRIKDLDFIYKNELGVDSVVNPQDPTYFDVASWTAAYSPVTKGWVSFYSFTPNYYVSHQNYFSSGLNIGDSAGIWNHLLGSNQTFQVFYGSRYPWIIETVAKTNYQTKMYEDFSYRLNVRRYVNEYDYHYYDENFDKMVFYNDRESSGLLRLVTQEPNSLKQLIDFPKFTSTGIDIIATNQDYTWSVNYFFDNLKENHTQPIWTNALNNVDKDLNNEAFNYNPSFKNHIRGQYLLIRMEQSKESRLKFIFEHFISDSLMYDAY